MQWRIKGWCRGAAPLVILRRAPLYLRVWMTAAPPPLPSQGLDPPLVCVVCRVLLVNTRSHCWPKNVGSCCVRLHVVALECSGFWRIAIWVCFGEAIASFIGYHEVAQESSSKQSHSLSWTQNRRPCHWSRHQKEFGGQLWQSRPHLLVYTNAYKNVPIVFLVFFNDSLSFSTETAYFSCMTVKKQLHGPFSEETHD